jgi:predicted nucleotidyltransferase
MITESQQHLIDGVERLLRAEPEVEAAWLSGSLGSGLGDEFSDVDVLVLVRDGSAGAAGAALAGKVDQVARPVLVNVHFGGRVISVVTEDWERFDLNLIEADQLAAQAARRLKPLFNRGDRGPPEQAEAPYRVSPDQLSALVKEFLRVLGLAAVVMGRREYVVALAGVGHLRGMAVDLMLEENAVPSWKRGGALRRNPLLTAEQRETLEALPPLKAERDSLIEAQQALAGVFLPRARRLAEEIGMAWPDALEGATRRSLEARLGIRF